MKYIFIFLILLTSLQADNIRWYANFDKAHQQALKENKILMVFLIKDQCLDCKKMLSSTFMDKEVVKVVNKKFICTLITKDQSSTYPIELLYTLQYPAIFFLDSNELFSGKNIFGYIDSNKFKKYISKRK